MIVKVLRAFELFVQNQIIETNKEDIHIDTVNAYIAKGVLQPVYDTVEKLDEVSTTLKYYGKSYQGALATDLVWTITKTTVVGTVTTRETFHDVAWDNRNVL